MEHAKTRTEGRFPHIPRLTAIVCALFVVFSLSGCGTLCNLFPSFCPPPDPVFHQMPTKHETVEYLNRRSRTLAAWRSTDATVTTKTAIGLPIRLDAMISVARPRNFRLVARSPLDHEADFGSNDERFWFWMRRSEVKRVFTIRHADLQKIQGRLPIPFRPDWVMESLGVIPLKAEAVTMVPGEEGTPVVHLVSEDTSPAGKTIRRVIMFDYHVGQVIRQSLFDGQEEIARAEFSNFREAATGIDPASPHRPGVAEGERRNVALDGLDRRQSTER